MDSMRFSGSPSAGPASNSSRWWPLDAGGANTSGDSQALGEDGGPQADTRNEELAKLEIAVLAVIFVVAVLGTSAP